MAGYLLDADVCIGLIKGDARLAERLRKLEPSRSAVCSVVRGELLFGAHNSEKMESNLRTQRDFVAPYQTLPFDDDAAEQYGILRADLRRRGTTMGGNDMMIAAVALANDRTLVTRNRSEFERIRGLRVEAWE